MGGAAARPAAESHDDYSKQTYRLKGLTKATL